MLSSPLPHLAALAAVGWLVWAARDADRDRLHRRAAHGLAVAMLAWLALATWSGGAGWFDGGWALLAGAVAPVVALAAAACWVPALRRLLRVLVRRLSVGQTIAVQAVRGVAAAAWFAAGAPAPVIALVAVPELLLGVSALRVARGAERAREAGLAAWNALGLLVSGGGLLLLALSAAPPAAGAPAPMQAALPLVLLPVALTPMLGLAHLLALAQIVRRSGASFG